MKSIFRYPFHILFLLVLLFSPMGGVQYAQAGNHSHLAEGPNAAVITHDLSIWNATYIGFVDANTYEKWQFAFSESHNFSVTVTPSSTTLVPLLILMDANGVELARGTDTLTSFQPAGNYSVQVQPVSGSGFYALMLREAALTPASVTTVVSPASIHVGETAVVTVNLNNIPVEGYTSAEFTCTYNATLGAASNIVVTNLFGADPAVALNGPQNGTFIVAVAGSNGNKATTGGAVFTFGLKGLQTGQTAITCTARASKGDNVLAIIPSTPASLTILASTPTPTPTPTSTPTSAQTSALTVTPTKPAVSPTPTAAASSPTPTSQPTTGTFTGRVLSSKPVTVGLYKADNTLATSVATNADGSFSLTAPAGTYTAVASSIGFLGAQGSVTLTAGGTSTLPTVILAAGDIDSNRVIDQFDAMTLGMNYNTASPAAADLNNDRIINVLDLELLAQNYRKTGPLAWR